MVERKPDQQDHGQPFGLKGEALARLIDFSIACDRIRGCDPKVDPATVEVPRDTAKQSGLSNETNTPDVL